MPLFVLFILLPLLELALLIMVGAEIGVLATLGLIFLTAVLGIAVIQAQGFMTLLRAREKLAEGTLPARELAEGFLLALAGALLIAPGFITDTLGLLLLLPPLRRLLAGSALRALQMKSQVRFYTHHSTGEREVFDAADNRLTRQPSPRNGRPDVIDGDFRRDD